MSVENHARVLLVEDDELLAKRLRSVCEPHARIVHARSAAEARAVLLSDDAVDAVLLDVRLPDGNGLDVLEAARPSRPDLPVLVVTGLDSVAVVNRACQLRCYIARKTEPANDFVECVVGFVRDETLRPRLMRREVEQWIQDHDLQRATAKVLRCYMSGGARADLPAALGCTEATVKWHVTRILVCKFANLAALREHFLAKVDREVERLDRGEAQGGGQVTPAAA